MDTIPTEITLYARELHLKKSGTALKDRANVPQSGHSQPHSVSNAMQGYRTSNKCAVFHSPVRQETEKVEYSRLQRPSSSQEATRVSLEVVPERLSSRCAPSPASKGSQVTSGGTSTSQSNGIETTRNGVQSRSSSSSSQTGLRPLTPGFVTSRVRQFVDSEDVARRSPTSQFPEYQLYHRHRSQGSKSGSIKSTETESSTLERRFPLVKGSDTTGTSSNRQPEDGPSLKLLDSSKKQIAGSPVGNSNQVTQGNDNSKSPNGHTNLRLSPVVSSTKLDEGRYQGVRSSPAEASLSDFFAAMRLPALEKAIGPGSADVP
jgi:hypothetical protein